jgi:geranylgeranyl diphosphate synthase type I
MIIEKQTSDSQVALLLQRVESLMTQKACRPDAERLSALIRYHLESGGGRVRARLALNAGLALDLNPNTVVALAASCELIHNASLLHDDLQDGDTQRRGREAAWCRFDRNTAMCAGTLMLSAAFDTLAGIDASTGALVSHLHHRTSDLIYGQTLDLAGQTQAFKLQDYVEMAAGKSGSLMALPLELVMIAAHQKSALLPSRAAGNFFAIAYQITDDLNDLEEDLSRSNYNIVGALQADGLDRTQAVKKAAHIAQTYLEQAVEQARLMPANSGGFLIELCNQLTQSIHADGRISCEQA